MRLRFGIKTLLLFITIVGVSCYLWMVYDHQKTFGEIPSNSYLIQTGYDLKGIDLRIVSGNIPIHQIRIEIQSQGTPEYSFIKSKDYSAVNLTSFRLEQSSSEQLEEDSPKIMKLPKTLEGKNYRLSTRVKKLSSRLTVGRGGNADFHEILDESQNRYMLFISIR